MTAALASTLPCTANPDAFQITGATSLIGRGRIVEALILCHCCPIRDACRADVANWPEVPRNVVVGGVFYDWRGRPRRDPPPLNPHAQSPRDSR